MLYKIRWMLNKKKASMIKITICGRDWRVIRSTRVWHQWEHMTHLRIWMLSGSDLLEIWTRYRITIWKSEKLKCAQWNYRIIEHDSSHNCSSSKEKNFITNSLHVEDSDQFKVSNVACLVYIAIDLDLKYRLRLEKLTSKEYRWGSGVWTVIDFISRCNGKGTPSHW